MENSWQFQLADLMVILSTKTQERNQDNSLNTQKKLICLETSNA